MKNLTRAILAAALVLAGASAHAQKPAAKKIYCWNEGGERVCGDALPAEAAGAAREEIDARTGITTRRLDRALTPDERAALAEQQASQESLALQEADRTRRGQALAAAYDSEQAVAQAYDQRITMATARLSSTKNGIEQTRPHLLLLLKEAGNMELGGEKVPPNKKAAILKVRADIKALGEQIVLQAREIEEAKQERDDAIALYREFSQARDGAVVEAQATNTP